MMRLLGIILMFSMAFSLSLAHAAPALAQGSEGPEKEIGGTDPDDDLNEMVDWDSIQPDSWMNCHKLGKRDGADVSTAGSMVAGLFGGMVLGLIGTGLMVLVQGESKPSPLIMELLEGDECKYAYSEAYASKSLGKKRYAALTGGLIGTLILVLVYLTVSAEDDSFY